MECVDVLLEHLLQATRWIEECKTRQESLKKGGLGNEFLKGEVDKVEMWLTFKLGWILTEILRVYISMFLSQQWETYTCNSFWPFFNLLLLHIWFYTLCNWSNERCSTTTKRELPWDTIVCFIVCDLQANWKFCPRLDRQHVTSDVASPSVWRECGFNWLQDQL